MIIDRISPDERHLPPSARTWARMIDSPLGEVLELRDPNHGRGVAADAPRHQYLVARGVLWSRTLPPAPLDRHDDETPWADDPTASDWRLVEPHAESVPWQWAAERGVAPYQTSPASWAEHADLHGDGGQECAHHAMPPADPVDTWADITGAPCPVAGCDQVLVWYEAGYVPGYRVCMARLSSSDWYDHEKDPPRHRFALSLRHRGRMVLVEDY